MQNLQIYQRLKLYLRADFYMLCCQGNTFLLIYVRLLVRKKSGNVVRLRHTCTIIEIQYPYQADSQHTYCSSTWADMSIQSYTPKRISRKGNMFLMTGPLHTAAETAKLSKENWRENRCQHIMKQLKNCHSRSIKARYVWTLSTALQFQLQGVRAFLLTVILRGVSNKHLTSVIVLLTCRMLRQQRNSDAMKIEEKNSGFFFKFCF